MCIPESSLRAYLDGELDVAEQAIVAAHLGGCERCRALATAAVERRDKVQRWIGDGASSEESRPAAVVLAELRSRLSTTPPVRGLPFALLPAVSLAVVVVAVAVLGIRATLHEGRSVPPRGPRIDSARAGLPSVVAGAPHVESPRQAQRAADRPAVERAPRPAGPRSAARSKSVERYVLFADDVTRPDMGMVVRVKVPVSFPSSKTAVGDDGVLYREIEADVLVTQDGRPYAVRLVQDGRTQGRK